MLSITPIEARSAAHSQPGILPIPVASSSITQSTTKPLVSENGPSSHRLHAGANPPYFVQSCFNAQSSGQRLHTPLGPAKHPAMSPPNPYNHPIHHIVRHMEMQRAAIPYLQEINARAAASLSAISGRSSVFNNLTGFSSAGTIPPPLAPSIEEAYRRKCIQLKQRMNEVEEANDASRARLVRLQRGIEKMRLERAFLLEQLAKRTSTNVEDSEGSPSPPPTVRSYDHLLPTL